MDKKLRIDYLQEQIHALYNKKEEWKEDLTKELKLEKQKRNLLIEKEDEIQNLEDIAGDGVNL